MTILLTNWLKRWWVAFFVCLAFSLAMNYHRVVPLNALLYSDGIEGQDCGQMVWNLWFTTESISNGHNPYYTKQIYYPTGANLSHHTLAAGYFPVTLLLKLATGSDPMYPLYAYRII